MPRRNALGLLLLALLWLPLDTFRTWMLQRANARWLATYEVPGDWINEDTQGTNGKW